MLTCCWQVYAELGGLSVQVPLEPLEPVAGAPEGAAAPVTLSPRAAREVLDPSPLTAAVNCSTHT